MNILTAEHEVECLKELKRQKDEYLKKLKSCGVRGQKELKKVKKGLKCGKLKRQKELKKAAAAAGAEPKMKMSPLE